MIKKIIIAASILFAGAQASFCQIVTEQFGSYINGLPVAPSVGILDQLYVRQGGISKQTTVAQLASILSTGSIGNINSVWSNDGAVIWRLNDRLFVGAAASVNGGNVPESPQDWLNIAVGGTQNSQMVSISTLGLTGATFASRASDWPSAGVTSNSIGVSFYGFANNTNGTMLHPAWGAYAECDRAASVNASCFGMEVDAANFGTTVDIAPSAMFPTAGSTVGTWYGCGGVLGGTAPCSAAMATVSNTQKFRKGIVFGASSLDSTVGNSGNGVAVEMGIGQEARWLDASGNLTAEIFSTKPSTQSFLRLGVPTGGGIVFQINAVDSISFQNNIMFPPTNNVYALGDDTVPLAWSKVISNGFEAIGAAFTVTSGRISYGGTTVAPGASTGGGTCPTGTVGSATVAGCAIANVAGTQRGIPFF